MRTVVFCFERLPACSLGCYGEWNIPTPEFDALASRSLVCENFFASPDAGSLLNLWPAEISRSALVTHENPPPQPIPRFQQVLQLQPGELPTQVQLVRLLQDSNANFLYIHFSPAAPTDKDCLAAAASWWGLGEENCSQHLSADEFAVPVTSSSRKSRSRPRAGSHSHQGTESEAAATRNPISSASQDRLIRHAANVNQCDTALSEWLSLLEEVLREGDVIVLTAASGTDHRLLDQRPAWVKSVSEPLIHLPLVIHRIGEEEPSRITALLESTSVSDLLVGNRLNWKTLKEAARNSITCRSTLATMIRNRDWALMEPVVDDGSETHVSSIESEIRLFLKPEDVWEVRDVASQYPEFIERYRQTRQMGSRETGSRG